MSRSGLGAGAALFLFPPVCPSKEIVRRYPEYISQGAHRRRGGLRLSPLINPYHVSAEPTELRQGASGKTLSFSEFLHSPTQSPIYCVHPAFFFFKVPNCQALVNFPCCPAPEVHSLRRPQTGSTAPPRCPPGAGQSTSHPRADQRRQDGQEPPEAPLAVYRYSRNHRDTAGRLSARNASRCIFWSTGLPAQ